MATAAERRPALHLDVHVRIDDATSAAEIDRIFADVGRRLRALGAPTGDVAPHTRG